MKAILWFAALLSVALPTFAQVGTVGPCPGPTPSAAFFSPPAPTSTDPITIVVHAPMFAPAGVTAQVDGNVIKVTMSGASLGLIPPPVCGVVVVGPLTRGNYVITYYLVRDGGPPLLQDTLSLAVADPIPTTTSTGLVALILLLSVGAWLMLSRRHHRKA